MKCCLKFCYVSQLRVSILVPDWCAVVRYDALQRIEAAYLLTAMSEIWFTTCTLLKIEFPKRGQERGDWLRKLQYGVFGLGNRQCEHFNKIATEVDKFVAEQGGQRLVPVGLGDDDQCIEDDLSAWRDLVCPELNKIFRGEDDATVSTSYGAAVLEFRIVFHDQSGDSVSDKSSANSYANGNAVHDAQHPCRVNVAVTSEPHAPASDRSCTHLEFDISGTGLAYETGDHVAIYRRNLIETVEEAERLPNLTP
ncbi:MFS transporter multidrug-resistance type transporter [Orobanche minor]